MRVGVFIDPSSTCTGYSVWDLDARRLMVSGTYRPPKHWDANRRIRWMAGMVEELVRRDLAEVVVIEDTSGHVGAGGKARGMNGQGLATYGKMIGYLMRVIEDITTVAKVEMVKENDWTRGKRKVSRVQIITHAFRGQYDPARDPGGDEADAIGLGDWWLTQQLTRR